MAEEHQKSCGCDTNSTPTTNMETTDRGLFDFLGKKHEEKPVELQEEVIVTDFEKIKVPEQPEENKEEEEVIVTEFEKIKVSEQVKEDKEEKECEKKTGLFEKLHRSHSNSSSSSSDDEEEVEEGAEKKKKKKKGLKEMMAIDREEEKKEKEEDTSVLIEKYEYVSQAPPQGDQAAYPEEKKCDYVNEAPLEGDQAAHPEEKKGFLEKIKEKLPGQHKKHEEATIPSPVKPSPVAEEYCSGEVIVQEGEAKEKKGIFEKIKEKFPGYHKNGGEEKKEESAGEH